ncbi:unnamed protein product [Mycena citricolor]|uniref:Uncharacterized protein n=1 Tax=Mycena citricolor TaxID=2018698 RepID=A0AAD2Q747_9AGAR|nr:unnamed protein product [Mycena citricolor]
MSMKRKFVEDFGDAAQTARPKQLKLIPFPNYEPDTDVCMSDVQPVFSTPHHTRLPSNVSSVSTNSNPSSPAYPAFDLYPLPFFGADGNVDPNSHSYAHYAQQPPSPPVGLLQPSSSFSHHGTGCSQIPKLKVACASGINGQRTMWSFCEQCGSISMVDDGSSS